MKMRDSGRGRGFADPHDPQRVAATALTRRRSNRLCGPVIATRASRTLFALSGILNSGAAAPAISAAGAPVFGATPAIGAVSAAPITAAIKGFMVISSLRRL
jgi:hypothetical protein